ncbi:tyrosine-type recombinase/integrase [Neobacillus sp. NRS-1170]|uniref:tyrosine-type recombinase/integrase n=1 Tax=Neobacillus sp. NRS-1170 TaxID=3233898 RepID=UPI003D2AD88B
MKSKQKVLTGEFGFHDQLQEELSSYCVKNINGDGSITIHEIKDSYFLVNNVWSIQFIGEIKQFREMWKKYKNSRKNVYFKFVNPTLNLEVKFVWYHSLFNEEWSLCSVFNGFANHLSKLTKFINEKYPKLYSLMDLELDKAEREWWFWLHEQGVETHSTSQDIKYGEYTVKRTVANFLRLIHSKLCVLTDPRDEWEKDRWDVRVLYDQYGVDYIKSTSKYYLDFNKIKQLKIREQVKQYIKLRLLSKNNFTWATSIHYLRYLRPFLSFIFLQEPTWDDLNNLKRSHIEKYIQSLHEYTQNNLTQKNAHPEKYVRDALKVLGKFLEDIQRYEYELAPKTHVRLLIFPEDKPKLKKKPIDKIDYIPDYVLDQFFTHINDLNKEVIPVVWIAYKTGLRISDVLGLTSNCLEKLNSKYSIITDIEKTYVKGHRVPIDEDLANILAVLIHKSKENSNHDNNPDGLIFIRYKGKRKGRPFSQGWVQIELNKFAYKKNITDENGDIFHFTIHQFRHTYAVKMLNGGADILTVQELLAHASPEMTLRYAKLLDDTKRKAFEAVMNQGVFSFDLNGEVQEIKAGEDIPEDILQALWQDHKLNAMENNYGTCHARLSGNCPYMDEAPCLTCNGGSPCKDLAIGFSDFDIGKYEDHLRRTTRNIELAKQYGREDIVEKGAKNLKRYEEILCKLKEGNIIFGRMERIKRKHGVRK